MELDIGEVMALRKIKLGLLGLSGLVYRCYAIVIQSIVLWILIGEWRFAVSVSFAMNLLSTAIYYSYHYWFARLFEMRKR